MRNRLIPIEAAAPLQVGARIYAEGSAARGSIGAIVSSPHNDNLLGVTTKAVMANAASSRIFSVESDQCIGQTSLIDNLGSDGSIEPAWKLLSLFQIEAAISPQSARAGNGADYCIDPVATLGQAALRVDSQTHRGRVTAVNLPAYFRTPGSTTVIGYSGLVEITSESGAVFSDMFSGGQAIYLDDGSLLGIAVGGIEDRSFVAPVNELMERGNFALADSIAIDRHNSQLTPRLFPTVTTQTFDSAVTHAVQFDGVNAFMRTIGQVPLFYAPSKQSA